MEKLKNLLLLSFMAVLPLFVTSCSDDDKDIEITEGAIVGTWKAKVYDTIIFMNFTESHQSSILYLDDEEEVGDSYYETGTWWLNDNNEICVQSNSDREQGLFKIVKLTSNSMTLKEYDTWDEEWSPEVKFNKVSYSAMDKYL